jgi:hypothetical protein
LRTLALSGCRAREKAFLPLCSTTGVARRQGSGQEVCAWTVTVPARSCLRRLLCMHMYTNCWLKRACGAYSTASS